MQFKEIEFLNDHSLSLLIHEAKQIQKNRINKRKAQKNYLRDIRSHEQKFSHMQKIDAEINERNASKFLIHHNHGSKKINSKIRYLPSLIRQDWSHLFCSDSMSKEKKFYVYAHIDPKALPIYCDETIGGTWMGQPFYIGKGTGDRAYDLKRNQWHGKMIEKLLSLGFTKNDIVKIVFDRLTEAQAFEIESKMIYFFGTIYGAYSGPLYNLDEPKTPKFVGVMERLSSPCYKGMEQE